MESMPEKDESDVQMMRAVVSKLFQIFIGLVVAGCVWYINEQRDALEMLTEKVVAHRDDSMLARFAAERERIAIKHSVANALSEIARVQQNIALLQKTINDAGRDRFYGRDGRALTRQVEALEKKLDELNQRK